MANAARSYACAIALHPGDLAHPRTARSVAAALDQWPVIGPRHPTRRCAPPSARDIHLSTVAAQAICVALVAIDQVSKTWRVQLLARGLGYRTAFARVFAFNVTSDASASLTPLRAGGEPVRFAGILYCGLSVPDTLALMGVEGVIEYATVLAIAGYISSAYLAVWWAVTRARLVPAMHRALPWIAATIVGASYFGC